MIVSLGQKSWRRFLHGPAELQRLVGPYRTHYIDQIKQIPPGTRVRVCGRVTHVRPLGHINFILLTDHDETIQTVWKRGNSPASNQDLIESLRENCFCSIEGTVTDRQEIAIQNLDVISQPDQSINRWPLQPMTGEDSRLKLRFLNLRENELHRRLKLRSRVAHSIRNLLQSLRFTEIETPILTASSPEGAREFLVPTRKAGHFFSLSQSPQQYKQLLMSGGFERYFQFARCFRDEDGRSDRQSEFTQIDLEMAYVGPEEVMYLSEILMKKLSESVPELQLQFPTIPLPRYSYDDAMQNYGSDKPDLRTKQMVLHDISQGWVAMICRKAKDHAMEMNLEGVVVVPVLHSQQTTHDSAIPDHVLDFALSSLNAEPGDCIIASTDRLALGKARNRLIPWLHERGLLELEQDTSWLWVTDFPLFQQGPGSRLQSCHHPFTAPTHIEQLYDAQDDLQKLLKLRAKSYDLIVNGVEVGGGSIRIHGYQAQKRVLSLLNGNDNSFKTLLTALQHGCPPHGGIAFGFDRLMTEFPTAAKSLRDAIAFPKSSLGRDLMMDAPGPLFDEDNQLSALRIQLRPSSMMNKEPRTL